MRLANLYALYAFLKLYFLIRRLAVLKGKEDDKGKVLAGLGLLIAFYALLVLENHLVEMMDAKTYEMMFSVLLGTQILLLCLSVFLFAFFLLRFRKRREKIGH